MYVLTQDVTSHSSGQLIPKGTALHSIYSDVSEKGRILAMASFGGDRHKLSFMKDAMEWVNDSRLRAQRTD